MWIDQLYSGLFGPHALRLELYRVWQIVVLVALIPWLTLGWFSVRREWRRGMLVFNSLSVFFLASWIAILFSDSWRLTFLDWRFFSIIQVGAFASCLLTLILGIICRVYCFGRGLPEYLNPIDDAVHDFRPNPDVQWDSEKVGFPDSRDDLPHFANPFPSKPPPAILTPSEASFVAGSPSDLFDTAAVERDYSFSTLYAGYTKSPAQGVQRGNGTIASFVSGKSSKSSRALHDIGKPKDWTIE